MTEARGQLGTIVSWRVPSQVSYDVLYRAIVETHLNEDLVSELHPSHAIRRALNEMRQGRVIRKLRRDGDSLHFQLTREYLDEREIQYEKEAELALDTKTGDITCDVATIREEARRLLAEHQAKRLTSDLTRLMHRVYSAYSADLIPIREQGGAYFVPDMHAALVDQTRMLLEKIGGRLRSFDVRLGSEDTAESVAESMSEYLGQLVSEFKESCGNVSGSSRKDVKEHRYEAIAELKRKLELYRGLLAGYADHISETVSEAETELMRKLSEGEKKDAA